VRLGLAHVTLGLVRLTLGGLQLPGSLAILAQPDLEEHQAGRSHQPDPGQHQPDHLADDRSDRNRHHRDADSESLGGFAAGGIEADLSDLENLGNGDSGLGFAEELAELDVPEESDGGSKR
jgi:hypothetical protein